MSLLHACMCVWNFILAWSEWLMLLAASLACWRSLCVGFFTIKGHKIHALRCTRCLCWCCWAVTLLHMPYGLLAQMRSFFMCMCVCGALGGKINILEHTLWRESCWYAQQSAVTPAAPAALWWVVRADKHRRAHIYYIHLYTSIYTCISLPFGFLAFQLKFDTYNPLYLCVCELAARCHALPTFPPAPTQRHIQW